MNKKTERVLLWNQIEFYLKPSDPTLAKLNKILALEWIISVDVKIWT